MSSLQTSSQKAVHSNENEKSSNNKKLGKARRGRKFIAEMKNSSSKSAVHVQCFVYARELPIFSSCGKKRPGVKAEAERLDDKSLGIGKEYFKRISPTGSAPWT